MRVKILKAVATTALALAVGFTGMIILEARLAEIDKVYGPQ
jgi:hypothetical protein